MQHPQKTPFTKNVIFLFILLVLLLLDVLLVVSAYWFILFGTVLYCMCVQRKYNIGRYSTTIELNAFARADSIVISVLTFVQRTYNIVRYKNRIECLCRS